MVRRSESQWRALFKAQQQSGSSVTQFCHDHKLNAKYFSLRRKQLSVDEPGRFIQLAPDSSASPAPEGHQVSRLRVIELEFGAGDIDAKTLLSLFGGPLR